MKKVLATIAFSALTAFLCIGALCGPDPVSSSKKLELLSPRSGSFTVGSTVAITFKSNSTAVSQVIAHVTLDNGKIWKDVAAAGVAPSAGTISWIVGDEYAAPAYATGTNKVKIRVADYYDETINDVSDTITVLNP